MTRNIRKSMLCIIMFTLMLSSTVFAFQLESSSSLNPVGSGARATGMGGAFIGVADDATAASWNPAGLIQLEKPEVSVVYSSMTWQQDYHPSLHPEMKSSSTVDTSGINYSSYAYPFKALSRNMIFSINYQRLYELDKNVSFNRYIDLSAATGNPGDYRNSIEAYYQKGYLYALSPALAVQVSPALSFGITLNFWGNMVGQNGWVSSSRTTYTRLASGNTGSGYTLRNANYDFEGFNANIGMLWNLANSFSIGAVYKSAFDGKVNFGQSFYQETYLNGSLNSKPPFLTQSTGNFTLKMPASYGLGLQFRPSDKLIFALDAYLTQWSDFMLVDVDGSKTNPISTKPISEGALKDTTQVRFGCEYLFIGSASTKAIRAGLFSDPEPGTGYVNKFQGFSLGAGYTTKQYSLDASYQYRSGKDVDGDIASIQPKSTDVTQQTMMVSAIWYF